MQNSVRCSLLAGRSVLAAGLAAPALILPRESRELLIPRGRARTRDASFQFRMGAGIPGDVNRSHPMSIVARMPASANPPNAYGIPVILNTDGTVRMFQPGDTALTDFYGVTVRPYPQQQLGVTSAIGAVGFGTVAPPTNFPIDILVQGFVFVQLPLANAQPNVGASPFIWCAATSGSHIQGQFETAGSGGNTATISWGRTSWFSQQDTSNVAELGVNY